jgi:alcohol dehydrogenase class IV
LNSKEKARSLITEFKGNNYAFGLNVLDQVGEFAASFGETAVIISNQRYVDTIFPQVKASLEQKGVKLLNNTAIMGAGPNAPQEDVYRIEKSIRSFDPDCLIVIGGGSSIDAVKAANVLASLGSYSSDLESYFGTGLVSKIMKETGMKLKPLIAVQTAASSGAHLTKYSNITDLVAGQKKLIVDDVIAPDRAVFDYAVTASMPKGLTIDGALDGLAHCLEVFYGTNKEKYEKAKEITEVAVELIIKYTAEAINNPSNLEAREALGLATDLGGYAIMVGGTNGAHLTSFSLVDVASHGKSCGIMNPYYTVFFAPAIKPQLQLVGNILKKSGLITADLSSLEERKLGIQVAEGLISFSKSLNYPTKLTDLPGFTEEHIKRALTAAKNPQLEMKLKNMPVALDASMVDEYMGSILEAAKTGDFGLIKNL